VERQLADAMPGAALAEQRDAIASADAAPPPAII